MSLFTPLINAWTWFKKTVIDHVKSGAAIAVTITETVKTILNNPVATFLEDFADTVTHSQLPTQIAAAVNSAIPKILAVELAVEGLPNNPTPEQVLAFEQSILKAIGVNSNNSKLYTELGAQIYGIIQANIAGGTTKFADWVIAVEQAYQDYKADLATVNTAVADIGIVNAAPGTVLPDGNEVLPN